MGQKTVHEAFARFFEKPSRESLRALLKEHVGELRRCDFKTEWPDLTAVAKHLLGLGNANGGCLVIGVKEESDKTLSPLGIGAIKDKANIINGIKAYLPEPLLQAVEIGDFSYDASEYEALVGKRFQVIFVHPIPELVPFVAQKSGAGIRSGAIYVRHEGSTDEASHEEVQRLIAQRVAHVPTTAQARDLKGHLEDVKVLYGEVPKTVLSSSSLAQFGLPSIQFSSLAKLLGTSREANPAYPKEDYEDFVLRLLEAKKRLIERTLGVKQ
ncbi:hypothetical protein CS053_00260 [Rhodanobacter glycinis]|uniref:Schlafen AlbA-2 domain-containing protein n=1 Tax=Rhodanobacter glycinis TaxID=582702 RepID=A0A5B9DVB1_9GAMM|nr:RNA-binding domain-containing protein [Rhodanobacter glycinis]QEE23098.1 hypothetical protein CS053_00260 [Rhodanobacter glycinis]